jgi:hypothetical protein
MGLKPDLPHHGKNTEGTGEGRPFGTKRGDVKGETGENCVMVNLICIPTIKSRTMICTGNLARMAEIRNPSIFVGRLARP